METFDEDDDIRLVRASATLLSDLESSLPKVLWKKSTTGSSHGAVHSRVRSKDLACIISLIEPFQGEPQLLDARLKYIVPPIVEACLEYLRRPTTKASAESLDTLTALSSILYHLCKVRGAKVIVGFFNNEPKYLGTILSSLESVAQTVKEDGADWRTAYVLLLWLSHMLLAPFNLSSFSAGVSDSIGVEGPILPSALPATAVRVVRLGLQYLSASTKAQDAAASMLARLVARPDMQKLGLADSLVSYAIGLVSPDTVPQGPVYDQLGPLRFLAALSGSSDLSHLAPSIYRACEVLCRDESTNPLSTNAIGKSLVVKIFRNTAILSLRAPENASELRSFAESTSILEDVIDHLLTSLGDRDTPVRYAAAKAMSLIISSLPPDMGHDIIQAVIESFREGMSRKGPLTDNQTVNALKWHGLTLALSHALFKRSASTEQLPEILEVLVAALSFEQRAATGSSIGTNVRDAANFGVWSLSRRYTTNELLAVDSSNMSFVQGTVKASNVIQAMAAQLILAACTDPAGNVRRGSSAALQELTGRHPNQVIEGISLVQIVDYQAVGLRRRGLIDVAAAAARLDHSYWTALVNNIVGWRGLDSADAVSREAAAESLAGLAAMSIDSYMHVALILEEHLKNTSTTQSEALHGIVLSMAHMLELKLTKMNSGSLAISHVHRRFWNAVTDHKLTTADFNPRILKSELHPALTQLAAAVCQCEIACGRKAHVDELHVPEQLTIYVDRLLSRQEAAILLVIPLLVRPLIELLRRTKTPLGSLGARTLSKQVAVDGAKGTLGGAGRAIALGALTSRYGVGFDGEAAALAISTLATLITAKTVDWRIIAAQALDFALQDLGDGLATTPEDVGSDLVNAIHIGLNDYTVDERGDIGSLVRLQALDCASHFLQLWRGMPTEQAQDGSGPPQRRWISESQLLLADILRLSLEKLDRVRSKAALCRRDQFTEMSIPDFAELPHGIVYIALALEPLCQPSTPPWAIRSLVEGTISVAGGGAETLLQLSRQELVGLLSQADPEYLHTFLTTYLDILRDLIPGPVQDTTLATTSPHLILPALNLLAYLLSTSLPSLLLTHASPFPWRLLLSTIQHLHHKSSDIPRLLVCTEIYMHLAIIPAICGEVLKKLLSMLKTNPFPRVRVAVAEVLWVIGRGEEGMRGMGEVDWTGRGLEGRASRDEVLGELGGWVDEQSKG
ncbi:hypothetical protein B0A48_09759 [Cryoendolithus antarcticus]|uniref:Uncharacterized protein n=1 Tax=Cryoendolithus antarcticus TaxID=1507870 RepID=A0A1V8T2M4_9PEZI|nr:hypothetical protein B0A48_09759 [Cryoendolithus antarcticus]